DLEKMTMEWEEMVFLTNSTEADEASPAPEADDGDMYPNRKAATIIGITKREFVIAVRFSSPNFPTVAFCWICGFLFKIRSANLRQKLILTPRNRSVICAFD
ncbi:unnamed protein product, partial [Ilex paraguariensis]